MTSETALILLPKHTQKKLQALANHYRMAPDAIIQKLVVDRIDDLNEAVILGPKRKEKA